MQIKLNCRVCHKEFSRTYPEKFCICQACKKDKYHLDRWKKTQLKINQKITIKCRVCYKEFSRGCTEKFCICQACKKKKYALRYKKIYSVVNKWEEEHKSEIKHIPCKTQKEPASETPVEGGSKDESSLSFADDKPLQ